VPQAEEMVRRIVAFLKARSAYIASQLRSVDIDLDLSGMSGRSLRAWKEKYELQYGTRYEIESSLGLMGYSSY